MAKFTHLGGQSSAVVLHKVLRLELLEQLLDEAPVRVLPARRHDRPARHLVDAPEVGEAREAAVRPEHVRDDENSPRVLDAQHGRARHNGRLRVRDRGRLGVLQRRGLHGWRRGRGREGRERGKNLFLVRVRGVQNLGRLKPRIKPQDCELENLTTLEPSLPCDLIQFVEYVVGSRVGAPKGSRSSKGLGAPAKRTRPLIGQSLHTASARHRPTLT